MPRRSSRTWDMSSRTIRLRAIGLILRDQGDDLEEAEGMLRYVRSRRREGAEKMDIYRPGLRVVREDLD